MPKITKRLVEGTTPDPVKTIILWDSELKGFGVVILPSGRRTYCVQYRNSSRIKKRHKVGIHGILTTEEARELAKKYLGKVVLGEDPASNKKQVKELPTIKTLAEEYLEKHGVKKRSSSLKEDKRILSTKILPKLGDKFVKNITRKEIEELHSNLKDYPYEANRVLALLSKMMTLAVSWDWISLNPVIGIERFQETKRDRWLTKDEMERLCSVLDKYAHHPTSFVFKFLLLTGARKGEVLNATWDQIDFEKGVWTKPSHLTKQKKKEHLPLSSGAIELLKQLKQLHPSESHFLFPGKIEGKPIQEVKTFWKTVLKEANIENFRIHDLRHTYASHLVSSGLSLSIVGKLLGHTQAATTQRYAHLADEPLREATELFGSKVMKISNTKESA